MIHHTEYVVRVRSKLNWYVLNLYLIEKDIYLVNRFVLYFAEFLDRFPVNLFLQSSIGQQKVFFFLTLNYLRWLPQLLNLAGT